MCRSTRISRRRSWVLSAKDPAHSPLLPKRQKYSTGVSRGERSDTQKTVTTPLYGGGYGLLFTSDTLCGGLLRLRGLTLVSLLRGCFNGLFCGFLDGLRRSFVCTVSSRGFIQSLHHSGAVIKTAAGTSGSLRLHGVQLLTIRQHHQGHGVQADTHNAQNPADQHEPTTGKHRTGKHQGNRNQVRRGKQKLRIHYRPT